MATSTSKSNEEGTMAKAKPPCRRIQTQRLLLREARILDLADFHELYTSKEVMRYWYGAHTALAQTRLYLNNMINSPRNGVLAFVIVLPPLTESSTPSKDTIVNEGKVIGHAGIWMTGQNEIALMLSHDYSRQGYMTEVLAALVPVFWEQGVGTVYADVDSENEASLKLLRKFGFEGTEVDLVECYPGKAVSHLRLKLENPSKGGDGDGYWR